MPQAQSSGTAQLTRRLEQQGCWRRADPQRACSKQHARLIAWQARLQLASCAAARGSNLLRKVHSAGTRCKRRNLRAEVVMIYNLS